MQTTLYYSPGACSLAPHILLEETGSIYKLVEVNVQKGMTQHGEFLRVNPKGRVPVLQVGTEIITEVPAICWYIGATTKGLLPDNQLEQARILEWFNWLSGTLHAVAFGGLWRPHRFVTEPGLHNDVQRQAKQNLEQGFNYVEQRLEGRQWCVGNRYSIVDPYLFVFCNWARAIGIDVSARFPEWHAHARRVQARPATQKALQQEGL